MTRTVLMAALTTGGFCAVFAVLISQITQMLGLWQVAGMSALSGFLGSLFASLVLRRR